MHRMTDDEIYEQLWAYGLPETKTDEVLLVDPSSMITKASGLTDIDIVTEARIEKGDWFIPDEYVGMDIEKHLKGLAKNDVELSRIEEELEFVKRRFGGLEILKFLKYLVDVMTEHDIVWGVGRGSSVSLFVLYLLDVHMVNPIRYGIDLPKEERT